MKNYNIFVMSNEHPRTINTPMMGRAYYTCVKVQGKEALLTKIAELQANDNFILEIRTDLGTYVKI